MPPRFSLFIDAAITLSPLRYAATDADTLFDCCFAARLPLILLLMFRFSPDFRCCRHADIGIAATIVATLRRHFLRFATDAFSLSFRFLHACRCRLFSYVAAAAMLPLRYERLIIIAAIHAFRFCSIVIVSPMPGASDARYAATPCQVTP